MATRLSSPGEHRLETTNNTPKQLSASRITDVTTAAVSPLLLPTKRRITALVLLLGAISGLAHVLCSYLYEYYANMMTGNTIRWTLALSRNQWNHGFFFGAIVISYSAGASIFRGVYLYLLARTAGSELSCRDWEPSDNERHKLRILSVLSPLSVVFFGVSDAVHRFLTHMVRPNQSEHGNGNFLLPRLLRLMTLATGFGMINAATQDALGHVTNAATGHVTRLGVGLMDRVVIALLSRRECWDDDRQIEGDADTTIPIVRKAAQNTAEATKLSGQFLIVLTSSLILSSVACRRGWIPLADLEPVIGIVFAVLYSTLLAWYTKPFVPSPWWTVLRWCQQQTLILYKLSLQRILPRENRAQTAHTTHPSYDC
jgi:hypothetical protein